MSDEWKASAVGEGDAKSWQLLEKTLLAGVQEQRRARRWGIFFKLLTFLYLFVALALFAPLLDWQKGASKSGAHTALIEVRGMIADKEVASADNIVGSLRAAFEDANTKGVILRINSPGGSPVQSQRVYKAVMALRERGDKPIVAVVAVTAAAQFAWQVPQSRSKPRSSVARSSVHDQADMKVG